MQFSISPYKKNGMWTFIDPSTGRSEAENALVDGIDTMLDSIAEALPNFSISFADEPIKTEGLSAGAMTLQWVRGDRLNEKRLGNWYRDTESGQEGWLCSVLFDYFTVAPDKLYLKVFKASRPQA